MQGILLILLAYLLGSIPFSYLASQIKGKDPRLAGTGNVGASNVMVVAGPVSAIIALLGDIAKGSAAVLIARIALQPDWVIAMSGLAAIIGHDFSIFLGFRGGKGVATTGGVLLALNPIFALIILLIWVLIMAVTRYFIPSTLLLFILIPPLMLVAFTRIEYFLFAIGALLLALYAHREDIQRFLAGKELSIPDSMAKYLKKA